MIRKRRGAVEARRAHNPDVPGSKPGDAIFCLFCFYNVIDEDLLREIYSSRTNNKINDSSLLSSIQDI